VFSSLAMEYALVVATSISLGAIVLVSSDASAIVLCFCTIILCFCMIGTEGVVRLVARDVIGMVAEACSIIFANTIIAILPILRSTDAASTCGNKEHGKEKGRCGDEELHDV
jgi:hypothetical protein